MKLDIIGSNAGGNKLDIIVKCCRKKLKLDIIGQDAAGGNMKLDIFGENYCRWKHEIRLILL
jgi:hypothetical protein